MALRSEVVICVGGPLSGGDLRSVSLDIPWALFPLDERKVCEIYTDKVRDEIQGLESIRFVGGYENEMFEALCMKARIKAPGLKIEYIKLQNTMFGTAMWLVNTIEKITQEYEEEKKDFNNLLLYYIDISSFTMLPLKKMLDQHTKMKSLVTTLCTTISSSTESTLVIEEAENNLVKRLISMEQINKNVTVPCSVYLISSSVFHSIKQIYNSVIEGIKGSSIRLSIEKNILPSLAVERKLHYHKNDVKDSFINVTSPLLLIPAITSFLSSISSSNSSDYPNTVIIPPVYISPRAKIGEYSTIGPNVILGDNVIIKDGVRIKNSALISDVLVENNSCIINSVIFTNVRIGSWARIEGSLTSLPSPKKLTVNGIKTKSTSIIGRNVCVFDEKIVYDCVVLPGATIDKCEHYEVIIM